MHYQQMDWFKLTFLAFFVFHQVMTFAQANDGNMSSELLELLSVLDEETSIATKTRLNSDFVPGMVTVLNGADMEAIGMPTVFDALSTVPGIQTLRLPEGEPLLTMRGLFFPFNTGNVTVLGNSLPMSGEASGLNSSVLFMPMQQIDRIEIVRGPGSAIVGDYAFMGLVNIITKKEENQVFVLGDNDDSRSISLQFGHQPIDKKFRWSANLASYHSGPNTVPQPNPTSDRPPPLPQNGSGQPPPPGGRPPSLDFSGEIFQKRRFAVFQGAYENTEITGQFFRTETTEFDNNEKSRSLGARQYFDISSDFKAEGEFSYADNTFSTGRNDFKGSMFQGDIQLKWQANEANNLLFGLKVERTSIDLGESTEIRTGEEIAHVSDHEYSGISLSLQDQIALTEDLDVTIGMQFYNKSDFAKNLISPRLAAVWHLAEHHIIKTQYAQGFRSPTFFESFHRGDFNNNLDFEINQTTEASYIYRRACCTVRLTGYYAEIEDMIFPGSSAEVGFTNEPEARMSGGELEWEQQLSQALTIKGNLSYADSRDNRFDDRKERRTSGSTRWLGNLSLVSLLAKNHVLGFHWHHVGSRAMLTGETDGYDLLDFTYNRFNFLAKGFNVSAGIRNLFNDNLVFIRPSPEINNKAITIREYPGRTV